MWQGDRHRWTRSGPLPPTAAFPTTTVASIAFIQILPLMGKLHPLELTFKFIIIIATNAQVQLIILISYLLGWMGPLFSAN